MLINKYIRLAIKVIIIVSSILFYYYSASYLISYRKSNSVRQTVFDALDINNDGLLSSKQIKSFAPCHTTYNKLNKKLAIGQHRVTYSEFKKQATDILLKKTFTECSRNVPLVLNKTYLATTNIKQTLEKFFGTYDLNYDDIITWKQYHTINQFYKKRVKGERRTFQYIDKNQDWRITTTQFLATKFYKFLSAQALENIKHNHTHHKVHTQHIQNNDTTL